MERTEVLIYNKLDLIDLVYSSEGNMVFEIGFVTIIGLALTVLAFKKIDKSYKKLYLFALVVGIISVIMTLKYFPFENLPSILKMLQFSFRMLTFSSFFFAIVVSINFGVVINNFGIKDVIVLTVIIVLLLVPMAIRNIPYSDNVMDEDILWPAYPVNENTARVHAGCASFEYLPSKAYENLDYIKTREEGVYILEGSGQIDNEQKDGSNMTFDVTNVEEGTVLELPYIYYAGYEVTLETETEEIKLETYESDNGFISIKINSSIEQGTINVCYSGTTIMKISMVISIIGFTLLVLYGVKKSYYVKV